MSAAAPGTAAPGTASRPFPAFVAVGAVAVAVWGASPIVAKIAVGGLDALFVGLSRAPLAALVALPVLLWRRLPAPGSPRQWALLVISSVGAYVAFPVLFSIGIAATSGAHASVINGAIPVFTGLFGALAARRWPGRAWFAGMALALAGVVALVLVRADGGDTHATVTGDLICVASSVAVGLAYVSAVRLAAHIGVWAVTLWGLVLAAVISLPIMALVTGPLPSLAAAPDSWLAVVYLAFVSSLAGYVAWYWALAGGGVLRIAPLQFGMPVVGLALAVAVLGEQLSPVLIVAAAAVIAGIAIAHRG